jgi:hypothetical protein
MGGGKGGAPAAPNYAPIASSDLQAAQLDAQTSADQLNWAKQQYADQAPYTKQVMTDMATAQEDETKNAQQAQDYYKSTYQPLETQFAGEAAGYNTPERAAEQSASAQADVASTFAGQRTAALSSLESYGIDPSQTRYGALDLGSRISQAAAQASAGTASRLNTEATGLALQGEAINIGRGYPGQVAQAYSTATGAGSSGVTQGLNTSSTYGNMMGSPAQWAGLQSSNLGGAANTMNMGFNNQMAGFNADAGIAASNMSGIGGLVGAGVVGGAIII